MASEKVTRDEHIDALLRREPGWSAVTDAGGTCVAVHGPVVLHSGTCKAYPFRVRVDLPSEFPSPKAHPEVWVLESPFPFDDGAHVEKSGEMCLELVQAHELDYERIGLVGVFDQIVFHLDRLRIHALTGWYPGPEYAHGEAGVRQFLREKHAELTNKLPLGIARAALPALPLPPDRQRCPCGSGQRFGHCHKDAVRRIRSALRLAGVMPKRVLVHRPRNPFRGK